MPDIHGLSPRVRGSPRPRPPRRPRRGSIPACAGKPLTGVQKCSIYTVYPRVCGEASPTCAGSSRSAGLSPRVRGSPERGAGSTAATGSIPACAGKPRPRARVVQVGGSIPACAGKPYASEIAVPLSRVYPRVCGEAARRSAKMPDIHGLSPRVRGSPRPRPPRRPRRGSIPACAGKPLTGVQKCSIYTVYPRVCGEAAHRSAKMPDIHGLSPRVRGSLSG